MFVRRQVRTIRDGDPVADGTQVEMWLHDTGAIYDTTETQDGWFEFSFFGNPGPHFFRVNYDDETHVSSSQSTGISGVVDIANLPVFIRSFRSGYVPGVLSNLAVTATGTTMSVRVASGAGYYRGILYDQYDVLDLTIDAADSQPRIDLVVVEVVPQGAGENIEGRSRLKIKKGTPATTPTAPGLTQTSSLWEETLAEVRVDPSVSAIASNKVTDRRTLFTPIIQPKSITKDMLADTATPGIRLARGGTQVSPHARTMDFATDDFLLDMANTDYSTANNPWARIYINKAKLLEYIEANIDIPEQQQPVENPTYTVRFNDKNFDASGSWGGGWAAIPNATVSLSLPAGAWLIESILNMSIRGTGSGAQCTIRLTGNGTPQGDDQSMRIFAVASGSYRQVVLSGRRTVSHSGTQTYTATVDRTHQSGAYVDFRDGVIYMKAYRV